MHRICDSCLFLARIAIRLHNCVDLMLIVFSGLPGTGKTTIARELARRIDAVYLRIDSIEAPMLEQGWPVEGVGYAVARAVAEDNLRLGRTVIADCVNPWPLTRDNWRAVATSAKTHALEIEVVCSDSAEHRRRVQSRGSSPTWYEVVSRDYRPWNRERLIIDTTRLSVDEAVDAIRLTLP
jgi:predicted kinase